MGRFISNCKFMGGLVLLASGYLGFAQPPPAIPPPTIGAGGVQPAVPVTPAPNVGIGGRPGVVKPQITNLVPQGGTRLSSDRGETELAVRPEEIAPQAARGDNEFQQFIARSTGQSLPVFGVNLFSQRGGFAPANNLPVTADYIVGPEDELIIRAWGQIDINLQLTVDRDGAINIPQVGVLQVAGLKASQIEGFVKTMVGRLFKDFELNVTFGRLRSVKVLVVGHIARPGNYTVSPLSTALSALFQAGGPSSVGSMRKIEVRRANQIVSVKFFSS